MNISLDGNLLKTKYIYFHGGFFIATNFVHFWLNTPTPVDNLKFFARNHGGSNDFLLDILDVCFWPCEDREKSQMLLASL